MSECNSGCEECKSRESCGIRKAPLNKESSIHKIIGIISGKGGVGKSTVTALIARRLASMGYSVGIMDADVTGPSVPAMFGIHGKVLSLSLIHISEPTRRQARSRMPSSA